MIPLVVCIAVIAAVVCGAVLLGTEPGRRPQARTSPSTDPGRNEATTTTPTNVGAPEAEKAHTTDRVDALVGLLCPEAARRNAWKAMAEGRERMNVLKDVRAGCAEQQSVLFGRDGKK